MSVPVKRVIALLGLTFALLLTVNGVAFAQDDEGATIGGESLRVCCGALLLTNIAILVWVVQDANNRGTSAGAWLIIVLIFGVLGLLAYLVARPQGKLVPCPNCGKDKPIRDQVCPHCGAKVV